MSDMYPNSLSEAEIQSAAEELLSTHGENAIAEASRKITELHARGEFSFSESWVWIRQRIRELQARNDQECGSIQEATFSE